MNLEKIEKIEYKAYEKLINIELFNEIIAFISNTRTGKGTNNILYEIENKCIWNKRVSCQNFQEKYKFQYFGELLERYEERMENNIENIRAIVLALGYGKNIIENSMIMGTQLIDFLNRIKSVAEKDIYIKGALYLYDSKKYDKYGEDLFNRDYSNTEEIIFVLSIFSDRVNEFFDHKKEQIIRLLAKDRNMEVIGNIGILSWLVKNIYPLIYKDRKKDISILKALIKLPTGFQKEDTTTYKELLNNGYSEEDIAYLNYFMLYYHPVPKTVKLGYSIVEEKIAINLCKVYINNEKSYENNVYNFIRGILCRYDKFDIKCYGYSGIKDAIKYEINVTNPITFTELYQELGKNLYSFDILDEKWDIVSKKMEEDKYEEILDKFLLNCKNEKDRLLNSIKKYNELTGKDYVESFLNRSYYRQIVFDFLVDNNVILLKDSFENILKNGKQNEENYLKSYIKGVKNKKSFEFLKYLLRINKYNINEINDIGFDFEELLNYYGYSYSSYTLNLKKKFLNIKEQKILFNCLEKFIFYYRPKKYLKFLEVALKYDKIDEFFKKSELRNIYLLLCELEPKTYNCEWLQKKFLTTEELEEIREKEKRKKQLEKEKELLEAKKSVMEGFKQEEIDTLEKLYKFCDKFEYSTTKFQFCADIVKEYLLKNISKFITNNNNTMQLMDILEILIDKEKISTVEFTRIMYEYIKKGVQKDEYINTTC